MTTDCGAGYEQTEHGSTLARLQICAVSNYYMHYSITIPSRGACGRCSRPVGL